MTREGAIITLTNTASLLRDGTRYMKPEHEKQFREAYEMAIKALEQPEQKWIPCTPDTMPEDLEEVYVTWTDVDFEHTDRIWFSTKHGKEVEFVKRKRGTWIKTGQSFVFPEKFRNYSCSECGYDVDKIKFNFCPNCGADMRGEQE